MRVRLLYTLFLILCLSAFASSKNECTCPYKGSIPCEKSAAGNSKILPSKEVSKEVTKDISDEGQEFSTFQLTKLLYI